MDSLCLPDNHFKMENISRKASKVSVLKPTRNPFINFIRDFRMTAGLSKQVSLFTKAAEKWRQMEASEKLPYYEQARSAPKKRRKMKMNYRVNKRRNYYKKKKMSATSSSQSPSSSGK